MSIKGSQPLAALKLSGSHFDIGAALGHHGRAIVHDYLIHSYGWAHIQQFVDHDKIIAARQMVQTLYPHYWQEIEGLAHGLQLDVNAVFAWNCRGDISTLNLDGCTTVLQPGETPRLSHNEDGDYRLFSGCAFASIEIAGEGAFDCFTYPASIPGHTFGSNNHGLVMTVNNIRAQQSQSGLPRMFVGREVLSCRNLDSALSFIQNTPRFGAFHFSLGQVGDKRLFSVEFTADRCSVLAVNAPMVHANHLIHDAMDDEKQIITASSFSRQQRGDAMLKTAPNSAAMDILWDQSNQLLPIYRRQPDDPDNENTLASIFYELGEQVTWRLYDSDHKTPRFEGSYP